MFTAVSLTPLTLWLIRNSLVANSVTNRTLAFHPVQRSAILTAIYTFGLWVLPGIQTTLVTGLLFVCLIGLVFILQFRLNRSIPVILIWCGLFILVYCGFLIASITFVDAHTPLDIRILFPVYAVSLICILGGLANLMPRLKAIPFVRVLPLGVCLAYLVLNMIAGSQMLNTIYNNGQGYTSQSWHQSELMSQAFLLSENATLYSNVPDAIYFVRDAVVQGIPLKAFATSLQKNDSYTIDFEAMVEDMHLNQAKIVYFNRVSRWYLPTQAELARNPSFSIIFENKEGMIYEYDRSVP